MEEEACAIRNVPSRMAANHKRLERDFKTFAASLKAVFVEESGTCSIVFESLVHDITMWYEYLIQQHDQAITLNKKARIPGVKWFSFAEPMIMELLNMLLSFLCYSDRYKRSHRSLLSSVFFREDGKSLVILASDDQKYSMENFLGNLEEVMLFMYVVANKLNSLLLLIGSSRIDVSAQQYFKYDVPINFSSFFDYLRNGDYAKYQLCISLDFPPCWPMDRQERNMYHFHYYFVRLNFHNATLLNKLEHMFDRSDWLELIASAPNEKDDLIQAYIDSQKKQKIEYFWKPVKNILPKRITMIVMPVTGKMGEWP